METTYTYRAGFESMTPLFFSFLWPELDLARQLESVPDDANEVELQ